MESSLNFWVEDDGNCEWTGGRPWSVTDERLFFSGGGDRALSSEFACLDVGDGERWRFLPTSGVIVDEGILSTESESE